MSHGTYINSTSIPDEPLMTVEIEEPAVGLKGWVCVHSLGKNGASGGVRCMEDVTKEEVKLLARAMTYKYAYFGIPQGGAKAGICLGYGVDPEKKCELIKAAARHLKPLILRSSIWSPWTDMNFYGEELSMFYAEVGQSFTPNRRFNSSRRTAISAYWSLEASMAYYGMDPRETTVTIEGFGSVASYLVPHLIDAGVKVVAVSNVLGTAFNPTGLNLKEILELQMRFGNSWITKELNWTLSEREFLFDIQTDIMIPCARVYTIDRRISDKISAKILLPISNVPCTDEALEMLDHRGIIYIPDFVVNGGGVIGHIKEISDPFGIIFKNMLERMLKSANELRCPVRKIAESAAHANYAKIINNAYHADSFVQKIMSVLHHKGMMPSMVLRKYKQLQIDDMSFHVDNLFR